MHFIINYIDQALGDQNGILGVKWGETNFSNVGGDKCSVMTSYVLSWADNNGLKVWQKIVRYIRMAQPAEDQSLTLGAPWGRMHGTAVKRYNRIFLQ